MAAFLKTSRLALPVVGIQLDAAGHAGLMRVLDKTRALIGISSGATLFCLERVGWDHGFRLTARKQQFFSELDSVAAQQDFTAFMGGAHSAATTPSALTRAYRPSRTDETLHLWVMRKPVRPQIRQDLEEV
jgi:hypothetical protein